MLYPTRNKVSELLNDYKFILMFQEILLDTYSPIHIDNALEKNDQNCFVLKNVDRSHQRGRYSLIGINPKASIKIKNATIIRTQKSSTKEIHLENPITYLSDIMEKPRPPNLPNEPKLTGDLIGYFAYNAICYIEKNV